MANRQSKQHASPVAVAYAQSVLELASEQQQAEAIGQELAAISGIVNDNPSFREVLSSPAIGIEARERMLGGIFRNNVSPLVFNTLGVLNHKNRLNLIGEIAQAYSDLLDQQLGKVEVEMTVAKQLSPEQLDQARSRIGAALGKNATIHQSVDETIIGGMVLRIGDKLIDASVRNQLASMKAQLLAAAPK
jgi:F-type H+-transporting ATPase subunit delta